MKNNASFPHTILFVDDEDKACKYFALALSDEFDVLTAGSVDEALQLLKARGDHIAVVISDQRMPEKSGVELLRQVREYFPHIVRLLTTAYTDIEDAIAAINRGEILRYIQKPWDIGTLKSELRQAINYFELRRERDFLLQEKLSVRQRLVEIDRVNQLLLLGEALPVLDGTAQALRDYLERLVDHCESAPRADVSGELILDSWQLTLAESARMQDFARTVATALRQLRAPDTGLPAAGASLPDMIAALASEAPLSSALLINRQDTDLPAAYACDPVPLQFLLRNLLGFLAAGAADGQPCSIDAAVTTASDHVCLQFSGTGDIRYHEILSGRPDQPVPPLYAQLLLAYLATSHLGGRLEYAAGPSASTVTVRLPLPGHTLAAPDPGLQDRQRWHEALLSRFEPELPL